MHFGCVHLVEQYGSTARHVECVVSRRDVTSQVEFGLMSSTVMCLRCRRSCDLYGATLARRAAASTHYFSTTRVVNYSSNLLLLEYSLLSITGCKFPFPVAVFLQSFDELLEFMETWGFRDFICPLASLEIDLNIYT